MMTISHPTLPGSPDGATDPARLPRRSASEGPCEHSVDRSISGPAQSLPQRPRKSVPPTPDVEILLVTAERLGF